MKNIPFLLILFSLITFSCNKDDDSVGNGNGGPNVPGCLAKFNYTITSGGDTLILTNQSIVNNAQFIWDFGDGNNSTEISPRHTYEQPGYYLVCLTAMDSISNCSSTRCDTVFISTGTGLLVEQKNRGILIDFSETWCPPCGSSGGPGFDSSLYLEGTSISAMKVYGSSSPATMNSALSNGLATAYNVSGVPDFWFNNSELNPGGGVYSSAGANYNWVNTKANAFMAEPVLAGVSLNKNIQGDSVSVTTRVKFFQAQSSGNQYTLAVYLVEDNIISNQSTNSGANPNYRHRNLLRSGNAGTYTGVALNGTAAITADQVFDNTFMLPKNSITGNNANLKAIAVIWKLGTTPAKVVNSNVVK